MSSPLENELPVVNGTTYDTLLSISGLGQLLYQARGLTQTLSVIGAAKQQQRTINATLVDVSNPAFRKYQSKISCSDVDTPPFDNLFPGMTVIVDCACQLCYLTGNPGSPNRLEVSGSSYVSGAYTFYRPVLTMLIVQPDDHFDEWKAENHWSLDLEEV